MDEISQCVCSLLGPTNEDTGGVASIGVHAHAMPFDLLSASATGIALSLPSLGHGHVLSIVLVDMPSAGDVWKPFAQ